MTSNPSIFEKAIGGSDDYDAQIAAFSQAGVDTKAVYEALVLADIRAACNLFVPLYESSTAGDGYVSLEVSPHLAHDTQGTIAEARRLHAAVNRPNLMIKVPATPEGIPAIATLLAEGINVNVTLMFNMAHYEDVAQAYIDGVAALRTRGGDVTRIGSVASFFVSRVDSAVDARLGALDSAAASALQGKIAVANARVVYQRFQEIFHGAPFAELRAAGAPVQRLLWASTSAKNPAYPATIYVDELIGAETVNTMPPQTVDAFRTAGTVAATLDQNVADARRQLAALADVGVDLDDITAQLQRDGVAAFAQSFDSLLDTLAAKAAVLQEA
jgi:transaldolase